MVTHTQEMPYDMCQRLMGLGSVILHVFAVAFAIANKQELDA